MKERLRDRLAKRTRTRLTIPSFLDAAVLVPVVQRGSTEKLVFTARPQTMPTHAGQVSMPGGKRSPEDPDLRTTALREASEELAISPATVEVLGELDDVATPHGFVITPVVGWIANPQPFRPDPREVDEVFELDVDTLAPSHRDAGERTIDGRVYRLHEYHVDKHIIWGATARIVHQLLELIA